MYYYDLRTPKKYVKNIYCLVKIWILSAIEKKILCAFIQTSEFFKFNSSLRFFVTTCVGLVSGIVFAILYNNETNTNSILHATQRHKYSEVSWDTNRTVAKHMRDEIRILCWIMTGPTNHKIKAQHIRHTWGKHCNTLLFMSSEYGSYIRCVLGWSTIYYY